MSMTTEEKIDAIQEFLDWRENTLDTSPLVFSIDAYADVLRARARTELAELALKELATAHLHGYPVDDTLYHAIRPALESAL